MKALTGTTPFPVRAFLVATLLVCLGLAASAAVTYSTLRGLQREFLAKRGQDIATALDRQARGPGRRNSAEFWRQVLQEQLADQAESGAWLLVTDGDDHPLAWAGLEEGELPAILAAPTDAFFSGCYLYSHPLRPPGMGRPGSTSGRGHPPVGRLLVGVPLTGARFLLQQARLQLLVTAGAIALLTLLSVYLARTVNRLLQLRSQEASQRHLADLGRMSATLAHEIRNPLGAIKGLTQVVQEELPADHTTQELMHTVVAEAQRLEKLVNDLLLFARPRPLQPVRLRLDRLVREVLDLLRPVAAGDQIALECEAPDSGVVIHSDPDALRQVLLNTVVNAIEASRPGGTVQVALEPGSPTRRIALSVLDRGEGLRQRPPESLFEPFHTTKSTGSGLGLPISRRILTELGGTIALSNREGGGAVCRIELPEGEPGPDRQPDPVSTEVPLEERPGV